MKKIAELNGDEFFDVVYALSPVLPMIVEMEVVQAQLFGNISPEITQLRSKVAVNRTLLKSGGDPKKAEEYQRNIDEATAKINETIAALFARDISKIIPLLASKENRGCLFAVLSVVDGKPIDEVRKYNAPQILTKITQVVKDTDFKSFLSYAEPSESSK